MIEIDPQLAATASTNLNSIGSELVVRCGDASDPNCSRSIPTLRTYVAKLRQLIPDGAAILTSGPAGYALAVEPTSVDAYRFEQLVHSTRDADSDRLLADALAMWRGNALEEFAHQDWARPLAARLDEMRLFAYERLFDTRLASGRHAAVVDMLTALVQVHPLRVRFHVQLVTALYRSGRQAEALAGIGIGCVETAEHAAVAMHTPTNIRGSAFGLLAATQSFGNLAASLIAGILWTALSPTWAFAYLASAMIIAAAILTAASRQGTPTPT